ncbi:uncharacterized protein LOC143921543 [Arctopsyche grandis]|uniref:uncharacterized protein LOC143921543 n=1 Tax=Arctopsyche grandis TaxID=121162 RepID=UPI00406D64FE
MFGRSRDTAVCCWLVRLVDLPSPRSEVVAGQELDVDWSAAVCRSLLLWVDWRCLGCTSFYMFLECLVEVVVDAYVHLVVDAYEHLVVDAYERNLLLSRRRIFWNAWRCSARCILMVAACFDRFGSTRLVGAFRLSLI